ncbi:MAG: ACT domain-containing protein [Sphingomonadaceae bacterium]|nr:ACT domain-containing protein [Sphingomonadaceae bacterium]
MTAAAMTTERLVVEYLAEEGALVRMLGVVERRGFILRRTVMAELPCGRRATLALTVEPRGPGRSVETLARQLGRLHGVGRVHQETTSFIRDKAA